MHDPSTVAHTIKFPWRRRGRDYRETFITIWHEDPQTDGSDDSCGWFMRARHGNPAVLEEIVKAFSYDWDGEFDSGRAIYPSGLFERVSGQNVFSVIGVTVNLFFTAALKHFKTREKAVAFMKRELFEIIFFAENPLDTMHTGLTCKFGNDEDRDQRIRSMAACVYSWILRAERPWWKSPKWHVWHWRLKVHPWQTLRRWLLSRCNQCGKRFRYGESPVSDSWDAPRPRFLRGETHVRHMDCRNPGASPCGQVEPS